MFTDFIGGFLGALGGLAVGMAALRYLLGKYIEIQISKDLAVHQHGLDKQISTLDAQLSRVSDVLSRRNEREFSVTEKAWELMTVAVGTASHELAGNFPSVIFAAMSDSEAIEAIDNLAFTSPQKTALRAAEPRERQRLHFEFSLEHSYRRVTETWRELRNWLTTRQIFLNPPIYAAFEAIAEHLHTSIATLPDKFDDPDSHSRMRIVAYKGLDGLDAKVDELAVLIRERFGLREETA